MALIAPFFAMHTSDTFTGGTSSLTAGSSAASSVASSSVASSPHSFLSQGDAFALPSSSRNSPFEGGAAGGAAAVGFAGQYDGPMSLSPPASALFGSLPSAHYLHGPGAAGKQRQFDDDRVSTLGGSDDGEAMMDDDFYATFSSDTFSLESKRDRDLQALHELLSGTLPGTGGVQWPTVASGPAAADEFHGGSRRIRFPSAASAASMGWAPGQEDGMSASTPHGTPSIVFSSLPPTPEMMPSSISTSSTASPGHMSPSSKVAPIRRSGRLLAQQQQQHQIGARVSAISLERSRGEMDVEMG